jgi:hypothetical protein
MIRRPINPQHASVENYPSPWMRYAGLVKSGDPNSSQSIDEIIYDSNGWQITSQGLRDAMKAKRSARKRNFAG